MRFRYQARDASGKVRTGETAARSADEASRQLRQDGLYLLQLEALADAEVAPLALFEKRARRSDIIYLTTQLAVMVDAGVPLAQALEGLARQAEVPATQRMLKQLQTDVEGGEPLSAALAKFPKQFDATYVNLVRASEASGTLSKMLDRIAVQARTDLESRQQVQGALMYPVGMLCMCVGVSVFLLSYVFPKLTPMFESKGLDLPLPTRVMMVLSNTLVYYWPWCVGTLVALVAALVVIRRQAWGRIGFDWVWLHVPIMGPLLRKVSMSRCLRTLATTINAGVPMLEALDLTAKVASNWFYEQIWVQVADQVTAGKQIHEALAGHRLVPATLLQMISSGESTGKLGQVLTKVSDYYDREVATSVKTATSLVEPIMVAVMGAVIGVIALAMLLPIFTLGSHAG